MANKFPINSIEAYLTGKLIAPGKEYPEALYGFPDYMQENLKHFIDVFSIPSGAIPTRRQKKNYLVWSNDIDEIEKICGTEARVRKAYEMAKTRYDEYSPEFRFILWRPCGEGMKKLLIAAIMQINEEGKQQEESRPEKVEVASVEERKQALKDLKSSLKKD